MKQILMIFLISVIVIVIAGLSYLKIALPNVGPPPEMKVDITEEAVRRGEYLANSVAVCMDCHSVRDWTLFSGPPKLETIGQGGEPFDQEKGLPGIYYSKNLTPYGLGDWTDGEIFRAIASGVSKDGDAYFPIMPHPNYGRTSEEDISAIIAYLRSLESKEYDLPESESDFPMNFIINTIPSKPQFMGIPDAEDQVQTGKYLATMASCGDCHTPFEKGKYDMKKFMAGGRSFPLPGGTLTTSNLTPSKVNGLGNWTEEKFVARFKQYQDSSFVIPTVTTKEFNTMMPWLMYATMTEEDLKAIFAYLQSLKPIDQEIVKWVQNK